MQSRGFQFPGVARTPTRVKVAWSQYPAKNLWGSNTSHTSTTCTLAKENYSGTSSFHIQTEPLSASRNQSNKLWLDISSDNYRDKTCTKMCIYTHRQWERLRVFVPRQDSRPFPDMRVQCTEGWSARLTPDIQPGTCGGNNNHASNFGVGSQSTTWTTVEGDTAQGLANPITKPKSRLGHHLAVASTRAHPPTHSIRRWQRTSMEKPCTPKQMNKHNGIHNPTKRCGLVNNS